MGTLHLLFGEPNELSLMFEKLEIVYNTLNFNISSLGKTMTTVEVPLLPLRLSKNIEQYARFICEYCASKSKCGPILSTSPLN